MRKVIIGGTGKVFCVTRTVFNDLVFLTKHLSLDFAEHEENEILVKFFKFHKCYDLVSR